ncbi:hypothetical protein IMCC9480_3926 [Oxalobacteraceae bacterium IMCC9480]|jgi:Na+(H+)/acetate symporter ActP|nr:hypothetical protein IMCC9480_3926 [Oxalobacteraceae bacterium IMCC9480]NDP58659.1 DUF2007 domain-containing protein [Oxalobacteraceae bacterium]
MKILYQAASLIEAHMIVHLLEQQHLHGRIDGEYLQGAIGELPASGMIRVMVAEQDFDAAQELITQWDAAQPPSAAAAPALAPAPSWGLLAAGFIAGVLCTAAYYHSAWRVVLQD